MYWPLLNMYSENLDLGWGVLIINRTFNNRMKGLDEKPGPHVKILGKTGVEERTRRIQ